MGDGCTRLCDHTLCNAASTFVHCALLGTRRIAAHRLSNSWSGPFSLQRVVDMGRSAGRPTPAAPSNTACSRDDRSDGLYVATRPFVSRTNRVDRCHKGSCHRVSPQLSFLARRPDSLPDVGDRNLEKLPATRFARYAARNTPQIKPIEPKSHNRACFKYRDGGS